MWAITDFLFRPLAGFRTFTSRPSCRLKRHCDVGNALEYMLENQQLASMIAVAPGRLGIAAISPPLDED